MDQWRVRGRERSLCEAVGEICERYGTKHRTRHQSWHRFLGTIGEPIVVKLCSRDPEPPPLKYVKGGGGIFKDMAIHDLDMARFLMDSEPVAVLASGSCQVNSSTRSGGQAFTCMAGLRAQLCCQPRTDSSRTARTIAPREADGSNGQTPAPL